MAKCECCGQEKPVNKWEVQAIFTVDARDAREAENILGDALNYVTTSFQDIIEASIPGSAEPLEE